MLVNPVTADMFFVMDFISDSLLKIFLLYLYRILSVSLPQHVYSGEDSLVTKYLAKKLFS